MTRLDQLHNLRDQIDAEITAERSRMNRIARLKARATAVIIRGTISTRVTVTVAQHYEITLDALLGRRRTDNIAQARAVACYLLHEAGESFSAIGRELNRDPSTVMYAVRRVKGDDDLLMVANYIAGLIDPEVAA